MDNFLTGLNNLRTKVDDLHAGKLKTVPTDFKKVSKLDQKIPDGTTLIHINHYNIDKQNLERKNWRD